MRQLQSFLSAEEQARASRFVSADLQERFAVARGRLREELGARMDCDPAQLQFEYGAHGKPALIAQGRSVPCFNISHSGDAALLGISDAREIGVDIEFWRDLLDEQSLARRYFSAGELEEYLALPPDSRTEGFFACWSRKEAYIKALGRGLSLSLSGFQVSLAPGKAPKLLRESADQQPGRRWCLGSLAPFDRCSAAFVIEGDACHIVPAP